MASTCPINASLVVLDDRWALLVVRDLMFAGYMAKRLKTTQRRPRAASGATYPYGNGRLLK